MTALNRAGLRQLILDRLGMDCGDLPQSINIVLPAQYTIEVRPAPDRTRREVWTAQDDRRGLRFQITEMEDVAIVLDVIQRRMSKETDR